MGMTTAYRNLTADAGGDAINYIGLVDENGIEISGGDPAYARKVPDWSTADNGVIRPYANKSLLTDLEFDIPEGTTVGGWRAYSAVEHGTNYGGEDFPPEEQETFTNQGVFVLQAEKTAVKHKPESE